ncbi:uncharacterized protein LOC119669961 [Teleopsis dalmanni]|uniref:uncharacterized protein LOC119669961 n=1 Tax=Teleopsis dalmanni TaxID=139649 RepID=UPI0018CEA80A|nr:uncharacterized protein LOC119669961 [Teleopsis dalmanni]
MYLIATVFTALGIFVALAGLIIVILRQKSRLIFGIYPRKGLFYHFKYRIALLVLKYLRQKFYYKNEEKYNTPNFLEKLDKPQSLSDNPKSYDVVSFMGANVKGEKLMITMERRRRGVLKACIYIWLPGKGLLCSPNLPDMVYFTTDGQKDNVEFRGSGLHIYPEQCMRVWRVCYEGELKQVDAKELLKVKLNLKFSSSSAHFDYNRDLSASVIADSVAREAWNDAFFNMLRTVDQHLEKRMHYEQNGTIEGEISLNEQKLNLQMKGFRDHSFGTERCLSTINRYVYFALFLEDGTNMVIGNLSQPSFFLSSLKVGYVCDKEGVYNPITSCNFELYTYGEKGTPPQHQNFIVHTAEHKYFVQIKEEETAVRYNGGDWESKVFNQFISCSVNGIQGHGLTEYLYRNTSGRPRSISCNDPEWYQKARQYERGLSTGEYNDDNEVFIF